ncbi:hypothetical protein GGH12_002806 [Coemansia sp. RSA 1822]|nr:hypothetical protein LPJ76_002645 [Coemansia sp. RSA 638]KAJ2125799.1 hypothetical protein IW147_000570 [Coemansia sp. RSA 720]KAJ2545375.1 hypothetical protein GGF49_000408 [Coemansia sp. RSA 1853]KAJ2563107.1 hypothetical protein GGH12_002806 [Coemansia sp. RSA 1822]
MSIAGNFSQLQRQLYLLGYSQQLPEEGVPLVSTLLKDMQASLDRVKELEDTNLKLEREERTSRAGGEKYKSELHALRTENNSMRTEVLNYTRELDALRREARGEAYKTAKVQDDLKLENMRIRAEHAETRRRLDECQKRLEARISEQDPGGRIPQIVTNRQPLAFARNTGAPASPPPAIVDLVDLSSRRINALEEEIEHLETKLRSTGSELSATQIEVKERDLEIQRLNNEFRGANGSKLHDTDSVTRLNDQIDYLHERAETLERECREQREQFQKEKEELHKRWVHTENERVRLSERTTGSPTTSAIASPVVSGETERLRAECANIKSLYAQTRDQLQELLKSGNADTLRAREQAKSAETLLQKELDETQKTSQSTIAKLRAEVAELQTQAKDAPAFKELAKSREKQIIALTEQAGRNELKLAKLETELNKAQAGASDARESASARQAQYESTLDEYRQLIEQHRKLDRSVKQAVSEVAELQKKLDERDHKLSDLTRRCDEYRMAHKQSASELRACRRTLDNYSGDLNTLRDAHANAQRDVDRLREELEQTTRLRQAVEMSKDDYKRQLLKSLSESDSHRSLVEHLQAERRALRVQVKAQFHLSQRLEQRLETLDPMYAHEPLSDELSVRLPTSLHLPPSRPRVISRTSSAAHSARSFDDTPLAEESTSSSISLP